MPNKLTICENIFEPATWLTVECENVCDVLLEHFKRWPDNAHIYHNQVSRLNEVTPHDEIGVEQLLKLTGHFYVVISPAGPLLIPIIISVALSAVSIGLGFLLRPHLPGQHVQSPNNQLADRSNQVRINQRIPDIFGTVRSIPDLISVPYKIFDDNNQEFAYDYMCIGRGNYTIRDIRDDVTPVGSIDGDSVEVYGPGNSPNTGNPPQTRIGQPINTPVKNIQEIHSVNGQVLLAPNQPGYDWIGPFLVEVTTIDEIWCNFVAQSGLYSVNRSGNQAGLTVTIQLGITKVDGSGDPIGSESLFQINLTGSGSLRSLVGSTLKSLCDASNGGVAIRAIRLTPTIIAAGWSVSDQIQWRDAYGVSPLNVTEFGNVTTVQSVRRSNPISASIKDSKLNLLVTRNLPEYLGGGIFSSTLFPSNNAVDILSFIALDPFIGNRDISELDLDDMYTTLSEIAGYFGTGLCTEFCYTFDNANASFEEMADQIAQAIFCTAYRRGNLISIYFEKKRSDSTLLFNHRNKVPRTETRTFTFGYLNDNDGIELDYVDPGFPNYPFVDKTITLYFPPDKSATNPKKVTAVGVRNNVQAYMLGWRLYQKLLLQNTSTEFQCTQEAALTVRMERILVANNTRPDTQDGEVLAQSGLTLTLSQPVTFLDGFDYIIYLQHYDDSIESISITPGLATNQVILGTAPSLPCVTDPNLFAKTTYVIVYTE